MGLQVLLTKSDENDGVECLDVLPGQVRHFGAPLIDANGVRLKVPHMGDFTLLTLTTASRMMSRWLQRAQTMGSLLPWPWRRVLYSLANSILRRAVTMDCYC